MDSHPRGPAPRIDELRAFVEYHGRLPRATRDSSVPGERGLRIALDQLRRRVRSGTVSLINLEAALEIPGVVPAEERHPYLVELQVLEASSWRRTQVKAAGTATPSGPHADPFERLSQLAEFTREHGRMPVRRNPEEYRLYHCVAAVRSRFRTGSPSPRTAALALTIPGLLNEPGMRERAVLLTSRLKKIIGPERPPVIVAAWERAFADVQAWFERTGSLPRRRSNDAEEYRLANWLNRQRTSHQDGILSEDRSDKLSKVPGALEPRRTKTPLEVADAIAAFRAEHGRLPSTIGEWPGESALGYHLTRLRVSIRDGSIDKAVLDLLAEVPGATSLYRSPIAPIDRLREVEAYVEENGRMPGVETRGLYVWVREFMRSNHSGNSPEDSLVFRRFKELRQEFPDWRSGPRDSAVRLAEIKEFVAEHGFLPRNSRKRPGEKNLYSWAVRAMKSRAADEDLKLALKAIFETTPRSNEVAFLSQLTAVEDFIQRHGRRPAIWESKRAILWMGREARCALADGRLDSSLEARVRKVLAAAPPPDRRKSR